MTWSDAMNRLKTTLFAKMAVDATLTHGSTTTSRKVIITLTNTDKLTDASIASAGQVDIITGADYVPTRGDLFTINNVGYRVKERNNKLYRNCDNVGLLVRVYVQKEGV